MKKQLLVGFLCVVLLAFSAMSAFAEHAPDASPASSGTVVLAWAAPVYEFAAPPAIIMNQSQNSVILGNFLVGDLFLEDGE